MLASTNPQGLTLMVRSAALVASRAASEGLQARPVTLPLCPVSDMRWRPELTSHTRTACGSERSAGAGFELWQCFDS